MVEDDPRERVPRRPPQADPVGGGAPRRGGRGLLAVPNAGRGGSAAVLGYVAPGLPHRVREGRRARGPASPSGDLPGAVGAQVHGRVRHQGDRPHAGRPARDGPRPPPPGAQTVRAGDVGLRGGSEPARWEGRSMTETQGLIPCSEAVRKLWDYLDNAVSPEDQEKVERHLSFCRTCCGELEFAKELRPFLASGSALELPVDVKARLERFVQEL